MFISEMLGHATAALNLDLFSHVSQTLQQAAVDYLDDFIFGPADVTADNSPNNSVDFGVKDGLILYKEMMIRG
jgi:hypothetical protein